MNRSFLLFSTLCAGLTIMVAPARAGMIISPTFGSSITGDPNSAAIEGVINQAINFYQKTFSDPITVDITFQEGGGLGQSNSFLYIVPYTIFHAALVADGKSADDATALTRLAADGSGLNNPVTGSSNVLIKAANAHALGISCALAGCSATEGGTITLNTSITNPGSPGSPGAFSLLPVVEHEIDEILGLGSTLGNSFPAPFNNYPSPEDFFRFTAAGARSFTLNGSNAYFSLNGTTSLNQFDNQNDGGDFADWQSNPHPGSVLPQVQDAFATSGANPIPGAELRALDVIGYDTVTPEPGTAGLLAGALVLAGLARRRFFTKAN